MFLVLLVIYRRIPRLVKVLVLAVLLFFFVSSFVRSYNAVQERNTNVHTHRPTR